MQLIFTYNDRYWVIFTKMAQYYYSSTVYGNISLFGNYRQIDFYHPPHQRLPESLNFWPPFKNNDGPL